MATEPFRYKLECYPMEGSVPHVQREDLLLNLQSSSPFPQPDVGDVVRVLADTNKGSDQWTVKAREFLYWNGGCTLMLFCTPNSKLKT